MLPSLFLPNSAAPVALSASTPEVRNFCGAENTSPLGNKRCLSKTGSETTESNGDTVTEKSANEDTLVTIFALPTTKLMVLPLPSKFICVTMFACPIAAVIKSPDPTLVTILACPIANAAEKPLPIWVKTLKPPTITASVVPSPILVKILACPPSIKAALKPSPT